MLKKCLSVFFLLALVGCATVSIPKYIKNENPYRKEFYASFEKVLPATIRALEDRGWTIEERADPEVYEMRVGDEVHQGKEILLITAIQKLPVFVASQYARLNVYVTAGVEDTTEVEVRYITIKSVTFKNFYDYSHDKKVQRLFEQIEENIQQ